MIKILISFLSFAFLLGQSKGKAVQEIIRAMDNNLSAKTRVLTSKITNCIFLKY